MVKEFLPLHGKKGLLFPVLRGSAFRLHCLHFVSATASPPLRPGLGFLARKDGHLTFIGGHTNPYLSEETGVFLAVAETLYIEYKNNKLGFIIIKALPQNNINSHLTL